MKILSSYTNKIILVNVVVFLLAYILSLTFGFDNIMSFLSLNPAMLFHGQQIWTLLTSVFMHANFVHLFVNMFSLFFIGNFVERIIGKRRFITFYLVAGIFAGLFFATLSYYFGYGLGERIFGSPLISGVGASGAIFGLVGLLAVLTPRNKVFLIAGPLIAIILQIVVEYFVKNPSIVSLIDIAVSIYVILSIFLTISFNPRTRRYALPIELPFWFLPIVAIVPLVIIGLFISLPIGNMAHLGGLILGLIYGFYLVKKYPRRSAYLSRVFSK